MDFAVSVDQRKLKHRQILGASKRTKKVVEHAGDGDTNCWRTWNNTQMLGKKSGGKTQNPYDYRIG